MQKGEPSTAPHETPDRAEIDGASLVELVQRLNGVQRVPVKAGDVLVHRGQVPRGVFVIPSGGVKIELRPAQEARGRGKARELIECEFESDHRPLVVPTPEKPVMRWTVTWSRDTEVLFVPWFVIQGSHSLRSLLRRARVLTIG